MDKKPSSFNKIRIDGKVHDTDNPQNMLLFKTENTLSASLLLVRISTRHTHFCRQIQLLEKDLPFVRTRFYKNHP